MPFGMKMPSCEIKIKAPSCEIKIKAPSCEVELKIKAPSCECEVSLECDIKVKRPCGTGEKEGQARQDVR